MDSKAVQEEVVLELPDVDGVESHLLCRSVYRLGSRFAQKRNGITALHATHMVYYRLDGRVEFDIIL